MVHALTEARRVLQPGGLLIDLRPAASNRPVELELPSARLYIGEIDASATFPDHHAADEALRKAIAAGHWMEEHSARFEVVTDMDTVKDLRSFAANLRRTVMPDWLPGQVERLVAGERSEYLIRTRREMVIARYRRR